MGIGNWFKALLGQGGNPAAYTGQEQPEVDTSNLEQAQTQTTEAPPDQAAQPQEQGQVPQATTPTQPEAPQAAEQTETPQQASEFTQTDQNTQQPTETPQTPTDQV